MSGLIVKVVVLYNIDVVVVVVASREDITTGKGSGTSGTHDDTLGASAEMQGGSDIGLPLFVAHVRIAGHAGLKAGDGILRIGAVDVTGFTHEQARGEMIRSGNEINLTVQPDEGDQHVAPRMSVSDADGPYQDVTSKTFKMLEKELPAAEAAASRKQVLTNSVDPDETSQYASSHQGQRCLLKEISAFRPASIFDKQRQQRAAYTKADKSGYTKPLGAK
ncbi:hypothetical protein DPMN_126001 [Dreissena polymorpha]|uniref:PDZ domain-containing protein n=1 Tax=Dreissena polymorpha TaxID=45954 RepID=A0A9D4GZ89_DREPO|nr:hypothetical protein DPMN_126001 [Dreissena polymorpha]